MVRPIVHIYGRVLVVAVLAAAVLTVDGPLRLIDDGKAQSILDQVGKRLKKVDRSLRKRFNQPRTPPGQVGRGATSKPRRSRNPLQILFSPFRRKPVRLLPDLQSEPLPGDATPAPLELQYDPVVKDADALAVLVIGDQLASALADGLKAAFADQSKLEIIDATKPGWGLTQPKEHDWSRLIKSLLAERNVDVVVIMIGTNDRRAITVKKTTHKLRTQEWSNIYRRRIEQLIGTIQDTGKPLIWVGLPPMEAAASSRDMAYFNALYSEALVVSGGKFVDIWARFLDEDGSYAAFGPGVGGLTRRLRLPNGIGFTGEGKLKLALFPETDLRRALREGETALMALSVDRAIAGKDGRQVGVPIPLDEPIAAFNEPLAGAGPAAPAFQPGSPQHRLIIEGLAGEKVAGRADEFRWPPQ
jgi:hypothetical protein